MIGRRDEMRRRKMGCWNEEIRRSGSGAGAGDGRWMIDRSKQFRTWGRNEKKRISDFSDFSHHQKITIKHNYLALEKGVKKTGSHTKTQLSHGHTLSV